MGGPQVARLKLLPCHARLNATAQSSVNHFSILVVHPARHGQLGARVRPSNEGAPLRNTQAERAAVTGSRAAGVIMEQDNRLQFHNILGGDAQGNDVNSLFVTEWHVTTPAHVPPARLQLELLITAARMGMAAVDGTPSAAHGATRRRRNPSLSLARKAAPCVGCSARSTQSRDSKPVA